MMTREEIKKPPAYTQTSHIYYLGHSDHGGLIGGVVVAIIVAIIVAIMSMDELQLLLYALC